MSRHHVSKPRSASTSHVAAQPDSHRPAPHHAPHDAPQHLMRLQGVVGNQEVQRLLAGAPSIQRTLTITNYNTTAGGVAENQVLNTAQVRDAITRMVSNSRHRATILSNLTQQDSANAASPDVHSLAQTLCGAITDATTLAQVRDAIGSTLINTNREEADEFDALLERASNPKSRAKGTPNEIARTSLPGDLPTKVQTITTKIGTINTKLAALALTDFDNVYPSAWAVTVKDGLDIRTAHDNGAGWLPAGNVAATFAAYDQRVQRVVGRGPVQAAIRQGTYTEAGAMVRAASAQLGAAERQYYAWAAHSGDSRSPYIEISVPGNKNGRVVYDFENNRFFYTIHYNWHKGYNPFFLIT